MQLLIEKFLLSIEPFVKWVDKVFTVKSSIKKVTGDHYYLWRDMIYPGHVFLTNTNGAGSNLINPSEINHGAIYFGKGLKSAIKAMISDLSGKPEHRPIIDRLNQCISKFDLDDEICYVIEAVGEGVKPTNLVKFMTTKDKLKMYEPKFCDEFAMKQAALNSLVDLQLPYDFAFSDRNDSRYCFEVCARSYNTLIGKKVVRQKEFKILWGSFSAYTSESFSEDKENWELIIDSSL